MSLRIVSSKLKLLAIAGATACSLLIQPCHGRRAYDSSGSASQSSSSTSSTLSAPTQNYYSNNQYSASTSTSSSGTSSTAQSKSLTVPQNRYNAAQYQHPLPQRAVPYPQRSDSNGTNFYGISPEQMSRGATVHENLHPANSGGMRGGYDPRWNSNFGTGSGAQVMARESGGLIQTLRNNFPLPMSGDEAQMFQVRDFAARANGGMVGRGP